MFIGSVTTKTIGKVRQDIWVVGLGAGGTHLAITYTGPLVGHVTWEGNGVQGLVPPFSLTDWGPVYVPQGPTPILWIHQPYIYAVVDWTRTTEIDINNPHAFCFEYTPPPKANNPHPAAVHFTKLTLNTQIQVSARISGVYFCLWTASAAKMTYFRLKFVWGRSNEVMQKRSRELWSDGGGNGHEFCMSG